MIKSIFTFSISFLCVAGLVQAQEVTSLDSVARIASINTQVNDNEVVFMPDTPPLNQIAGAPPAFYSYYWEFDDGDYSTEKTPKHVYKKAGDYEVRLWATNNYDTGKPPSSRPKKLSVNTISKPYKDPIAMDADFTLKRNREPVPDEEMVVILSYKNPKDYVTNGRIYLFYNEQQFKNDNFDITDIRVHNNEELSVPEAFAYTYTVDLHEDLLASTSHQSPPVLTRTQDTTERKNLTVSIDDAKAAYKDLQMIQFQNMKPNEERNVFLTMKTTPEMIKDTSAIVTIRGIYVPDANYDNHQVKDMEMEIVTSHDPNKMASNATFMNYRLVRFKTLKFKIKFQNNGEGPARTIRLETDIPEMLDKSSIEVTDMYPKCEICPKRPVQYSCLDTSFTDTQAIFTFKNIYLPGSQQKNVKEYDSTQGFVKYKIKFQEDFHKKKTKSRTAIIFDKNEPIITNYATTRFLPGISIGAKAGMNSYSKLLNAESYFFGATLSPYKSYRWYWQIELLNNFTNYKTSEEVREEIVEDAQGIRMLQRVTTTGSYENIDWDVPILIRYNLNNYVGFGIGLNNTITVSEKEQRSERIDKLEGFSPDAPIIRTTESESSVKDSFTNLRTGLLVEATLGFARIGPSLGARYVVSSSTGFDHWQFYAIWKF